MNASLQVLSAAGSLVESAAGSPVGLQLARLAANCSSAPERVPPGLFFGFGFRQQQCAAEYLTRLLLHVPAGKQTDYAGLLGVNSVQIRVRHACLWPLCGHVSVDLDDHDRTQHNVDALVSGARQKLAGAKDFAAVASERLAAAAAAVAPAPPPAAQARVRKTLAALEAAVEAARGEARAAEADLQAVLGFAKNPYKASVFKLIPLAIVGQQPTVETLFSASFHEVAANLCVNCGAMRDHSVHSALRSPPRVLLLQLKRFVLGRGGRMVRIGACVGASLRLDLKPFLRPSHPDAVSRLAAASKVSYTLKAAVYQDSYGRNSIDSGHYIAYICRADGSTVERDDDKKPVVRDAAFSALRLSESYVFMYEADDADLCKALNQRSAGDFV